LAVAQTAQGTARLGSIKLRQFLTQALFRRLKHPRHCRIPALPVMATRRVDQVQLHSALAHSLRESLVHCVQRIVLPTRQEPLRAEILRCAIEQFKNIFVFSCARPHTEDGPDPPRLPPAPHARPAPCNVVYARAGKTNICHGHTVRSRKKQYRRPLNRAVTPQAEKQR
jgi:hypothetical protein